MLHLLKRHPFPVIAHFDWCLVLTYALPADAPLPPSSVFTSHQESRKFQGPVPFTFDHEPQTNSIIVIKGARQDWSPRPVTAAIRQNTFLDSLNLSHANPRLSSVFYIEHINYRWERGKRHPLPAQPTPHAHDNTPAIDDE
jgi:hypothetical protein